MKLSISLLAAIIGGASAFAPSSNTPRSVVVSKMSSESVDADIAGAVVEPINGWVPDASKPCFGLPGAVSPLGYFDPLGFCKGRDLVGVKRFREAEVLHARVAMMAVIGFLVAENTPTIAYGFDAPTIGINQIPEVPVYVLFPFFLIINLTESFRAKVGWVEPKGINARETLFTLRDTYYPGDIGFDPLNLKPTNAAEFESMQNKELNNGRLAMLAAMGMIGQELATGDSLLSGLSGLSL